MDAYDILSVLNNTYDLCDDFDRQGFGVYALTDGENTSREALKLELAQFLLWVGNANGIYSDGELALVGLVLGMELDEMQAKQIISELEPNPSKVLSLMGFLIRDKAANAANGTKEAKAANVLIDLFSSLGDLMVAFDDNPAAKVKKSKFINGMQTYVQKNL